MDTTLHPLLPYQSHPPAAKHMLTLIGYDITCPKRLRLAAKICEEYGARVQYSFFECHLTPSEIDELWHKLNHTIDPEEDRLVAYLLDSTSAKRTRTAGHMVCPDKVITYLI